METKNKLSEILKSGLTQDDVSTKTGISQATISRIFRGLHVDIKASTARAIDILYDSIKEAA